MKTILTFFILVFVPFLGKAQNIYTTLHINDAYDINKKKPIKKIESKTVL